MRAIRLDYPGRPGALDNVDLVVPAGTIAAVAGASGSGKSSLLAVAAGLERIAGGAVFVMGEEMDPRRPRRCARLRHDHVGIVFQHLNLLAELDVKQNVGLPLELRRVPARLRHERVLDLLARFGLADLAARRPGDLSGGEQQRVAIARALAAQPGLLLVDEPTSALDDANAATVVQAIREAAHLGAAVVVASHDPRVLPAARFVLRLANGRMVGPAAPEWAGQTPPGAPPSPSKGRGDVQWAEGRMDEPTGGAGGPGARSRERR